jgi:hypothetical protein
MKKTSAVAFVLFVFALPACAQQSAAALKETLVKLEQQSWVAWKNHDGKYFDGFLSDDHVELGFNGPTDKAAVVKFVASGVCTVKSYTVDHFEVTQLAPDAALLTYHAAQDTTCNGNPVPSPVWASSLFVKRGERWLNALYQHTPAAQKK